EKLLKSCRLPTGLVVVSMKRDDPLHPGRRIQMKFMVIVKATPETEAGVMPSAEIFEAMSKFNEEMIDAGIMISGEGLMPSSKGARLRFYRDKQAVTEGPCAETK